jgi:bacterioferritin
VHANEAKIHKDRVGARIVELGGKSEPVETKASDGAAATLVRPAPTSLATVIDQDVAADRAAIASLRAIAQCFAEVDPTTRALLDEIIAGVEERAGNLEELLKRRPAA